MKVKEWLFGSKPGDAKKRAEATAEVLRDRYGWQKVTAPRTWRPTVPGEELCGYYGGKTSRSGVYGQYDVIVIHVPHRGTFTVSGTAILQLVDSAMVGKGHPIRIIWKGEKVLDEVRTKKLFELFIAEGDPLAEDELPVMPG